MSFLENLVAKPLGLCFVAPFCCSSCALETKKRSVQSLEFEEQGLSNVLGFLEFEGVLGMFYDGRVDDTPCSPRLEDLLCGKGVEDAFLGGRDDELHELFQVARNK